MKRFTPRRRRTRSTTDTTGTSTLQPELRIIDAALNRAGEGLRVAEDFVRFVLDDRFLTGELKSLRHDLTVSAELLPAVDRHAVRDTRNDVGAAVTTATEGQRGTSWDVCAASLSRVEQALRSLEEYSKILDAEFAARCESLRYRTYTLEKAIDIVQTSRHRLQDVRLCVLVDGGDSEAEFVRLVRQLVGAGVGMIQLREKAFSDRKLVERARILMELAKEPAADASAAPRKSEAPVSRAVVIINDRADVAVAVHADGVHLGQDDLTVKEARAIVGPRMFVGVSTHNISQARKAVLDGADYLGAGPTFPSQTKAFGSFAGLDYLREVSRDIRLPTFAIGGVSIDNLTDVMAVGIERVAVGAAISQSREPGVAARELSAMLQSLVALSDAARATGACSPAATDS